MENESTKHLTKTPFAFKVREALRWNSYKTNFDNIFKKVSADNVFNIYSIIDYHFQ